MVKHIAIASGKGGTGKTTVAVGLAAVLAETGVAVAYVDCDVEEPNGHLFLRPVMQETVKATMPYPVVDQERCISCGKCQEICQYNAVILIMDKPLVFPEMCHACGGCVLVCPSGAITEAEREIGIIETGKRNGIRFMHGKLQVGQVLSPPLIRKVKMRIPGEGITILDCPPGTSCPMVTSIRGADYVLLVTEPTPFGLNDLRLAVDAVRELRIPFGVFINRADIGTQDTEKYCKKHAIQIMGRIPDDRRVAEAYSRGELLDTLLPLYGETFRITWEAIEREAM
ncbi:ATP-binding protein [bacterium]|nr:ATP-binding protein [bacterium]